jgi:hypothetical protein
MDRELRNALRTTVTRCRTLLEKSVAEVLEGTFAIYPDGTSAPRASVGHLTEPDLVLRDELLIQLDHIQATMLGGGAPGKNAVEQLVREVAFTHLNRLCAFKMLETRKHMREAVGRGLQSTGFKFYLAEHDDDEKLWSGGQQELAYRNYLLWLSTSLAEEVGPLFSPDDPANRLVPSHATIMAVLDELNTPALAQVWSEDETIGWVYQYFTPKELRDKARKESAAPRNSYELAFRNQFYTPRYVVEFLVDNTLGRTWYEMRNGETELKERCQYLVYRPDDEYEPRTKKDPRDFRILDPACGSGHFLLYAFDVLTTIYEEAWADPESPASEATGNSLQADYPDLAVLNATVPALVLQHNLHGIDIDLRSTQIAALALWLRAQRAFQDLGIQRAERPSLPRPRIVVAEPMPGEREMLNDFLRELAEPRLHDLILGVWQQMRLASEAGSLLRIDQHINEALGEARHQAFIPQKPVAMTLFEPGVPAHQKTLEFTVGKDEHEFWEGAQERLLAALEEYARRASNGQSYLRRVFADNARQGFDFVELALERFDVVLMNPPFGAASAPSRGYVESTYPQTKNDVYSAFIERGLAWLRSRGMLGAITSRTGFFLTSFQRWREDILLEYARPIVVADLGQGVLDTAMVETAAYALERMP